MTSTNQSREINTHTDHSEGAGAWMFTFIPVSIAFAFYVVFLSTTDLENKNLFIAFGAAAGFIGLESYWIVRGLFQKDFGTVLFGFFGIGVTLAALYFYLSYVGVNVDLMVQNFVAMINDLSVDID